MSDMDSAHNQNANSGEGGQADSPVNSDAEIVSQLEQQLKNMQSQIDSMRSEKDKGIAQTNRRLSEFAKQQEQFTKFADYLTRYETPAEAARQAALDALITGGEEKEIKEQGSQVTDSAGQKTGAEEEPNLVPLLLGSDGEKDPQFVRLIAEGKSPNQAAIQIAQNRQQQKNVNQNAASGFIPGQGNAPDNNKQTALQSEYRQRLEKIPQGQWKAITDLKSEFRKRGLEVW